MNALINAALEAAWPRIEQLNDTILQTPSGQSEFTVVNADENSVTIRTGNQGNPPWHINKPAFFAALKYLAENGHGLGKPCEIASNTNPDLSGPLCLATRKANTADGNAGPRVITYIVPILQKTGLVKLDGGTPNRVWLV